MAVFSSVLGFAVTPAQKTAALGISASSAEIVVGQRMLFSIVGTGNFNLKFGLAGMAAAALTDFFIPANTIVTFDTSTFFDRIRVFNNTAATIDIYVQQMNRS